MDIGHAPEPDRIPLLVDGLAPPVIAGVAALAHRAYAGASLPDLLAALPAPGAGAFEQAAYHLDAATAHELCFQPAEARRLQALAIDQQRLYRVAPGFHARSAQPLRLLALIAPGDLMVNTPLDFITAHLDVQLDLLFIVPGQPLPVELPDHDVAFFAVSESEPATLRRLIPLYTLWPRPVLNDPAAIFRLARDIVAPALAAVPGCSSPQVLRVSRRQLRAHLGGRAEAEPLAFDRPVIIRPCGSHAGQQLSRVDTAENLVRYLDNTDADTFFVTEFVDYASADGLFRKLRVALVDGRPLLCHMAISEHWMVHYLNAGMTESPQSRAEEAQAMSSFDAGFAARHSQALAGIHRWTGLDYLQIDCAEAPDGRLVVFEVDVAAVIHAMDPPDVFAYKPAQMQKVFGAFGTMLEMAKAGPGISGLEPKQPAQLQQARCGDPA